MGKPASGKAANEIIRANADLVLLQEAPKRDSKEGAHFWEKIFSEYPYSEIAGVLERPHEMAILSKKPLANRGSENVSAHLMDRRILLFAEVFEERRINIICAHFGLTNFARQRQKKAVERLAEKEGPLLVAGDLNDWSGRLAPVSGMACAGIRKTFPSRMPILSLDRIWTKGIPVENAFVPSGLWRECSDHLPIATVIRKKGGDV